jgi:putative spermidine/putrescine transport system permease protein
MRDRLIVAGQFLFTLIVAAFLIVPAILSMLAGITVNYFRGIASGVTLQWVIQVWDLYAETIGRSFLVAGAALFVTLVVGEVGFRARSRRSSRCRSPFPGLPSRLHFSSSTAGSAISAARGFSFSPAM